MRPNKQIGPTVPQVVGGAVPAFSESGGKRHGKHLKRQPRTNTRVLAINVGVFHYLHVVAHRHVPVLCIRTVKVLGGNENSLPKISYLAVLQSFLLICVIFSLTSLNVVWLDNVTTYFKRLH